MHRKEVELHAHTRFSTLGRVTAVSAYRKGRPVGPQAIAITDHGVVQAFPEAYEASCRTGVR